MAHHILKWTPCRCHSENMMGRGTFAFWCIDQASKKQIAKTRTRWNRPSTTEKTQKSENNALCLKYRLYAIGSLAKKTIKELPGSENWRQKLKKKMLPTLLAKGTITQTATEQLNNRFDRGYRRKRKVRN